MGGRKGRKEVITINPHLLNNLPFQTMDALKQFLTGYNVMFTETLFKTEDGIASLGPQIFVS